jgi:hypothetical protein
VAAASFLRPENGVVVQGIIDHRITWKDLKIFFTFGPFFPFGKFTVGKMTIYVQRFKAVGKLS